ncbi:MAG: transglutaminase-like domain-containing protein [Oscillospiraceae bacterium]
MKDQSTTSNRLYRKTIALLLLCVLLAGGCVQPAPACKISKRMEDTLHEESLTSETSDCAASETLLADNCVLQRAHEIASLIFPRNGDEVAKTLAAYEYVIAHTSFALPAGLDIWRVRGGGEKLSYLENRALSPLLFGVGSCEDYAAALILLLREGGIEARYVPGLTASVRGDFVDHAWVVACVEGMWYHLDPQLEDNVMRNNHLMLRYFLKSDMTMLADHRWGDNLIRFGGLTKEQISEVHTYYRPPACSQDAPAHEPIMLPEILMKSRAELEKALSDEMTAYERQHGALPPLALDIIPPVFGNAGYGDPAF